MPTKTAVPELPEPQQLDRDKALDVAEADLTELVGQITADVDAARDDTSEFRDALADGYQWRRNQVGRPFAHLPFKGAADIRFPIVDKYIGKMKDAVFVSITDAPHVARFTPKKAGNWQRAQNLELYFDSLFWADGKWQGETDWLADRWAEQGRCVAKITWERVTEPYTQVISREEANENLAKLQALKDAARQKVGLPPEKMTKAELRDALALFNDYDLDNGVHVKRLDSMLAQIDDQNAETITIIRDRVVREGAEARAIYSLDDITVPSGTCPIADAEWVSHDVWYTPRELRQEDVGRGGKYENVEESIEVAKTKRADGESTEKAAERQAIGVSDGARDEDYIRVREWYGYVPARLVKRFKGKIFGDDETPIRAVISYCPDAAGVPPLRVMELPFDHGKWPFEDCAFDGGKRFYDCRGIPQLIQAFAQEYNISRNAAINRRTITLSPPVVVHSASKIDPKNFRQVGHVFKTDLPPSQAIHIPQWPDLSSGFEFDAEACEQFISDYLGFPDLRMRGYQDSPSATQVQQVQAPAGAKLRRRLELFHNFLGRVYDQVRALEKQYRFGDRAPKQRFAKVQNPEESQEIGPEDFAEEYVVRSGGDLQRMDDMLATQSLLIANQMTQQPQMAPFVKPYDVLYTTFSKLVGPTMARQWLRGRNESMQAEKQFNQMQAMASAQMQKTGKNSRNTRYKQLPTGRTGIVPQ